MIQESSVPIADNESFYEWIKTKSQIININNLKKYDYWNHMEFVHYTEHDLLNIVKIIAPTFYHEDLYLAELIRLQDLYKTYINHKKYI